MLRGMIQHPFPGDVRLRVPVVDAIECMVHVLGIGSDSILLVSTVDDGGYVGPGDSFSLSSGVPSPDVLFHLHRQVGASSVLFGSRAALSIFDPEQTDVHLTRSLLSAAHFAGIDVVEHVLVSGNSFRLMLESLENNYLD